MNYAGIKYCDIANGLGCRTVLFVSGCRNHCKGCFQPQTWEFDYGEPFDEQIQNEILDSLKPAYVQGITLLGGDPFEEENQEALVPFMRRVKERYPNKDVWAYTGYLYEELLENGRKHTEYTDELLSMIDVLVDGPFIEEQKDITLKFKGSANQRVIDMEKTRATGESVYTGIYENMIRGFEMKKKCDKLLGILCYALGILAALYVGGYLMLIKPIHVIIIAFGNDMLTLPLLLESIIKIAFSTTFAGLVWCIGYIGYNFFKGNEDPDWAAIEARFRNKHSDTTNEDLLKEREV